VDVRYIVPSLEEVMKAAKKKIRERPKVLPTHPWDVHVVAIASRRQSRLSVTEEVDRVLVFLGRTVEQLFNYSIGACESRQALDPEDGYAHDERALGDAVTG
jgi:hypothetical protein